MRQKIYNIILVLVFVIYCFSVLSGIIGSPDFMLVEEQILEHGKYVERWMNAAIMCSILFPIVVYVKDGNADKKLLFTIGGVAIFLVIIIEMVRFIISLSSLL